MPEQPDSLDEALGRVLQGRRWSLRRGRRALPATAALSGVVLLALIGITAPWTEPTAPVLGHGPAIRPPVALAPETSPPEPPRGRLRARPPSPTPDGQAAELEPAPAAEPDPGPDPGGPPPPPSPPAMTSTGLSIGGGLIATLYVGQLDAVIRRLDGKVTFNTNPSFRSAYPTLCVATVVVEGVSGTEGAVYAHGLGAGWGGAEAEPNLRVSADAGVLHQQLVIPPSDAQPGRRWTPSASVSVDGARVATSGEYQLVLDSVDGSTWQWRVETNGVTVECRRYPG